MALAYRVRTVHSGLPGSPYLSTHTFAVGDGAPASTVATLVQDFWQGARNAMGTGWTALVSTEIEAFDEATGDIVATYPFSPTGITAGSSGNEWSAKQGILALRTQTFRGGKRVQGRLFIPAVAADQGEQVPTSSYRGIVSSAASELLNTAEENGTPWCVFSRPTTGTPARAGAISEITTVDVRGYWGVLRSRRD